MLTAGRNRGRRIQVRYVVLPLLVGWMIQAGCSAELGQIGGNAADGGGVTKTPCTNNAQCAKNEVCKNKVCEPAPSDGGGVTSCKTKIDCQSDEDCVGGRCVPAGDDGGGTGGDDVVRTDGGPINGDGSGCGACGSGYRCNAQTQKCEAAAIIRIDPSVLDFGAVPYNSQVQLDVTISNDGKADLKVLSIDFEQGTNPDQNNPIFTKTAPTALPATLKQGDYITLKVSYRQDDAEPDSGALLVTSTDLDHPLTRVPMKSGYKGSPDLAVVDATQSPPRVLYPVGSSTDDYTVDIGNVALGGTKQTIVTFMNATQGNAILSLKDLKTHQKGLNEFQISFHDTLDPSKVRQIPIFLSQADLVDMYVSFSPTLKSADDETDADLTTNDSDVNNDGNPGEVLYLKLKAKAGWLPPGISVSKTQVTFGEVQRNTIASDTVRVCDDGGDTLTILATSGLQTAGTDYSVSPTPLARVLNPSDCFDITVYFGPKNIGQANNTLIIDSNDTNNPHIAIPISGTGTDPTITVFPQSIDFGLGYVGKPATPQVVSMKNTGIGLLKVNKIELTPGSSPDFTLSGLPNLPVPVRDNQQDTVQFSVNFTASAKGKITGAVQIDNTDSKNPSVIVNVSGEGTDCPAGYGDCDGNPTNGCETNVLTDKDNCNGCGRKCTVANGVGKCVNGDCKIDTCNLGFADCDGIYANGCEVDTTGDANNCSACNSKCTYPNAVGKCVNSQCQFDHCNTGYAHCSANPNDGCEVNILTDVTHCGDCTTVCSVANGTPKCDNGNCAVASCTAPWADCDTKYATGCEINLKTDANNCNGCGSKCTAIANGTPGCSNGACVIASCAANYADCDGQYGNGCEVNLQTDKDHCGTCIKKCTVSNGTPKCASGNCAIASCTAPWADCINGYADGCETNTLTDAANCGGCNISCAATNGNGHNVPACNNGSCSSGTCFAGYADCNLDWHDGCEIDTTSDPAHCGNCSLSCSVVNGHNTPQCVTSLCKTGTCNTGYKDCNGNWTDGCEKDIYHDSSNCGDCGVACSVTNGTAACDGSGHCYIVSCTDPWANCDGQYTSGCNINTSNDKNHCGNCATVCSPPHATGKCVSKACQIDTCDTANGWYDLDGTYSDGCECQADAYDRAGRGNGCGNSEPGTVILGDLLDDSAGTVTVTGNIHTATDEDWYRVRAVDSLATDIAAQADLNFKFTVKWVSNPNNEFLFDVQSGSCGAGMCTAVNAASPAGDGSHMSQYYNFRATTGCQGPNPCGENPCSDQTNPIQNDPGKNYCADNTQYYYIRVYRDGTKPKTCSTYSLKISNGIQNP